MGESVPEYESVYGYSMGQTEPRMPLYEYPDYDYQVTEALTNFELPPREPVAKRKVREPEPAAAE
jgi:lysine 2,3-aminomutase